MHDGLTSIGAGWPDRYSGQDAYRLFIYFIVPSLSRTRLIVTLTAMPFTCFPLTHAQREKRPRKEGHIASGIVVGSAVVPGSSADAERKSIGDAGAGESSRGDFQMAEVGKGKLFVRPC